MGLDLLINNSASDSKARLYLFIKELKPYKARHAVYKVDIEKVKETILDV